MTAERQKESVRVARKEEPPDARSEDALKNWKVHALRDNRRSLDRPSG